MKMTWRKTIFLSIFLIVTGLAAFGWWLTMTDGGARCFVQIAGSVSADKFSVESVTGRLAEDLLISGMKLEWAEESLSIERLSLRWNLWSLLRGKLDIQDLAVQGMNLALNEEKVKPTENETKDREPDMEPLANYLPRWLKAEVNRFYVENFRVTEGKEEVFFFKDLTLSFSVLNHNLTLREFSWRSPYVHLNGKARLQMKDMILEMEANVLLPDELVSHGLLASIAVPPSFPGRLKAQGSIFAYRGEVSVGNLENQGILLTSRATGSLDGLHLEKLYGYWLKGTVQGDLLLDWEKDFFMKGELFGRGLDPAVLNDKWPGKINVDVKGGLETPAQKPLQTEFAVTLHPSTLLSHSLAGTVEGSWDETDLVLKDLFLEGEGLLVKAGGTLAERLDFKLHVENLADWLPESRGRMEADGWLKWQDQYLTIDARGEGADLSFGEISTPRGQFTARHTERGGPLEVRVSARQIRYANVVFQTGEITATGTAESHVVDLSLEAPSGKAGLEANLQGSHREETWYGRLQKLSGHGKDLGHWNLVKPVDISAGKEKLTFTPLIFQGKQGGVLRLSGDYRAQASEGYVEGSWHNLNLSQFDPWLPAGKIWGQSRGNVTIRWKDGVPNLFESHIRATGGVAFGKEKIHFRRMALDANWAKKGLEGTLLVDLDENGKLNIGASSGQPVCWGEPRDCPISMELESLNLDILRDLFPGSFPLSGNLFASGKAQWLGDRRFSWQGWARIEDGGLGWKTEEPVKGQILARIDKTEFNWDWQNDFLNYELALSLEKGGNLTAEGTFPIGAELPLKIREKVPLKGQLTASMREWGLLTALLPDLVRETRGEIDADISLAGTWQTPLLNGELTLKKMGGYLPSVGVQLEDMTFSAVFQGREAKITELRLNSGPGSIQGKGFLAFPHGGEFDYRLELTGKNFQLADLPEARILAEPDLVIQGSEKNFSLTGNILLSDFLISGTRETPDVQAHRDVVVIRPEEAETKAPSDFDLDIRVKISLGEKSFIRTAGLDAQLEGEVSILQKETNKTLAKGQIRVVDGSYAAFGTNLNVNRGHINFTGGPADNPSLDILALREVGKVRAGVRVTGTAELPEVNLYSRPAMPDKDIIGYIFLGRRMRTDQQESDLLALGAGALLPQGPGFFRRLGFTDIDLGGLFSEEGAVRLRYRLRKNWEVESTLGDTSGVDLFHVIEFE